MRPSLAQLPTTRNVESPPPVAEAVVAEAVESVKVAFESVKEAVESVKEAVESVTEAVESVTEAVATHLPSSPEERVLESLSPAVLLIGQQEHQAEVEMSRKSQVWITEPTLYPQTP